MGERWDDSKHGLLSGIVEEQRVVCDALGERAERARTIVRDVVARLRAVGWYAEYAGTVAEVAAGSSPKTRRRKPS